MIRNASLEDIPMIQSMAEVVFRKTYEAINPPEQMDFMMEWMYSKESLTRQMQAEGTVFLIVDNEAYTSFRYEGRTDDGRKLYHLEKLSLLSRKSGQIVL